MGGAASALTGSKPNQATAPKTNYNSKMAAMEEGLVQSPVRRNNMTMRKNNGVAGNMERGASPHYGYPMSGTTTPQNPSFGGRRKRSKKSRSKRSKRSRKN